MAVGCGVDVGERAYYAACLDTAERAIRWPAGPMGVEATVAWVAQAGPQRIAIDSPPRPHRDLLGSATYRAQHGVQLGRGSPNRRVAEWRLGIGGCYATPGIEEAAPGWMRSGMRLYRAFTEAGYELNLGRSAAPLLEVHPTYGFRSLLSLDVEAGRVWCDRDGLLRPKLPVGSIGHRQRVALLQRLLTRWNVLLDSASVQRVCASLDWADALLAACLAVLHLEGLTAVAGDAEGVEGGIQLSKVQVAFPEDLAAVPRAQLLPGRSRRGGHVESSGMLLRLGNEGLGRFTQLESLERVLEQYTAEGIALVPLGVPRVPEATQQQARDEGLVILLAHAGIARLRLQVTAIHGDGSQRPIRALDVWDDREDVWEGNAAPYWAVAEGVERLDLPVDELLFRHGGVWQPGLTRGQTAWLHFRYPEAPPRAAGSA